jgi:hypothetical protein
MNMKLLAIFLVIVFLFIAGDSMALNTRLRPSLSISETTASPGAGGGGPSGDALLLETGDYLLLETGDYLLLE